MPASSPTTSSVKAEKKESSSTPKRAVTNFVRISDLQKSGCGIDFKNQFGNKRKASLSSSERLSSISTPSPKSERKTRAKEEDTSTSKVERRRSGSNTTKRTYNRKNSGAPKKIEKSDRVSWVTQNGKRYVVHNGKKYTGAGGLYQFIDYLQ